MLVQYVNDLLIIAKTLNAYKENALAFLIFLAAEEHKTFLDKL